MLSRHDVFCLWISALLCIYGCEFIYMGLRDCWCSISASVIEGSTLHRVGTWVCLKATSHPRVPQKSLNLPLPMLHSLYSLSPVSFTLCFWCIQDKEMTNCNISGAILLLHLSVNYSGKDALTIPHCIWYVSGFTGILWMADFVFS